MPQTATHSIKEPSGYDIVECRRPSDPNLSKWVLLTQPESIKLSEEITPNSDGSHKTWKSFEHYKSSAGDQSSLTKGMFTVDLVTLTDLWVGSSNMPYLFYDDAFGAPGKPDEGLPLFYHKREDGGFVPAPADLNDLQQHSLRVMLPKVKSELSLINTIIELKDFRSLLRGVTSRSSTWRSRLSRFRRNLSLREVARLASGGYLQYMFNFAPLVSDVMAVYHAVSNAEKRINDLITREGRVRTQHFNWVVTEFQPEYRDYTSRAAGSLPRYWPENGQSGGSFPVYTDVDSERLVITDPAIFHAEIQYNYNFTGYQREHARVLGILDSLGVNINPAIIWNALPWTFVIDWFIGVNRWLDSFEQSNLEPQINILNYLWSIKRRRTIHCRSTLTSMVYYPGSGLEGWYPPSVVTYPSVEQTSYRRTVGLPDASSIESSGLNLTEFSLGAALVLARRRRPHRRR